MHNTRCYANNEINLALRVRNLIILFLRFKLSFKLLRYVLSAFYAENIPVIKRSNIKIDSYHGTCIRW